MTRPPQVGRRDARLGRFVQERDALNRRIHATRKTESPDGTVASRLTLPQPLSSSVRKGASGTFYEKGLGARAMLMETTHLDIYGSTAAPKYCS